MPAGQYCLYGDITSETGFSDTLTARFNLSDALAVSQPVHSARSDPDDAWQIAPPLPTSASITRTAQTLAHSDGGTCRIDLTTDGSLIANRDIVLRFSLRDDAGRPVLIEPYLGMAGHLVLRRQDGTVFTHLHPSGSFSMAAQQLFEMREDGRAPLKVASAASDPFCRLPTSAEIASQARSLRADGLGSAISFPYAFPKPGWYRLWLQVKVRGDILTAVFDTEVLSPIS
jgi:hypothetical protein